MLHFGLYFVTGLLEAKETNNVTKESKRSHYLFVTMDKKYCIEMEWAFVGSAEKINRKMDTGKILPFPPYH